MVIKTQLCAFSESRIYPGHGSMCCRRDGQTFWLGSKKAKSMYEQRKKPQKLAWTQAWRRLHKKNVDNRQKKKVSVLVQGLATVWDEWSVRVGAKSICNNGHRRRLVIHGTERDLWALSKKENMEEHILMWCAFPRCQSLFVVFRSWNVHSKPLLPSLLARFVLSFFPSTTADLFHILLVSLSSLLLPFSAHAVYKDSPVPSVVWTLLR